MKVLFDTNVYIAEALLGATASTLLDTTIKAGWRIFTSPYQLSELERVMIEHLDCTRRLAILTRRRVRRRARLIDPPTSRHQVPDDSDDSPILRAALAAGVDYVITNDLHLLTLAPYEGLRLLSMSDYRPLLGAGCCSERPTHGRDFTHGRYFTQTVFTFTNSWIPNRPSSRP